MLNPTAASRRTESKVPGILSNTQNMRLPRNSCHFKAPRGTNLQQHKNRKAAAAKTKISKPKEKTVSAEVSLQEPSKCSQREGPGHAHSQMPSTNNSKLRTRSCLPNIDQETEKGSLCECVTCRQQQQPEQHPSSVRRRSC